ATDDASLTALGGGVAFNTGQAIGIAYATNSIRNQVTAVVDGSTVTATAGDVELRAVSTPELRALAAGAAQADQLAIGGSLPVNDIQSTIAARAVNGAQVTATAGAVRLFAQDDATISSLAGGAAVSGEFDGTGLSFGAGVAKNLVANTVQAILD